MAISLREVNKDNWQQIIRLKLVLSRTRRRDDEVPVFVPGAQVPFGRGNESTGAQASTRPDELPANLAEARIEAAVHWNQTAVAPARCSIRVCSLSGCTMPRSVMSAVTNDAGVTSKAGL